MKGKGLSKVALILSLVTAVLGAVVSVFQIDTLYHKSAPDDLVHKVYNQNKYPVRFLEIYI